MAQWFLQKQIDEISAEIRALRASVYNVDGAIDESNPLAVKAKALETKLDDLQQLLQNGGAKVQLTGTSVPLRGLASERPAASAANKGYVYWSLDTGDVSVSTGTTWRSLGVA